MFKEFIPYKLALELKELGFNDDCLGVYRYYGSKKGHILHISIYKSYLEHGTPAPLYQQAFDWLLAQPNLYRVSITYYGDQSGNISHGVIGKLGSFSNKEECLTKLIEILKNENIQKEKKTN